MAEADGEQVAAWLGELIAERQAGGRTPSLVAGVDHEPTFTSAVAGAGELPGSAGACQYRIGSITKTFTAALVMQLRDVGALELHRPLTEYLPTLPTGDATLRDLLAHRAGVSENPHGPWWELGFRIPADELFNDPKRLPMTAPSTYGSYHYSNLGYALVGWLVERLTGKTWAALLQESLLDPLALARTSLEPGEPYAIGHIVHPWAGTAAPVAPSTTGGMAPAGQLWSSVEDLLRWGRCLLGDDEDVLGVQSATEMQRPVGVCDARGSAGQGTGLQLFRHDELVFAGHAGSVPGFCAALITHAPTRAVAAVCANSSRLANGDPASIGIEILEGVIERADPGARSRVRQEDDGARRGQSGPAAGESRQSERDFVG